MNPDFRALFPGAQQQVYLNIAAKGLVPTTVRDVVTSYMDDCVAGTMDKDLLREQVDETRAAFAAMIGAEADEIAITKNVSEGLNLFAASLGWEAGDNVVFCPQLEHPNNVFLWYNLRKTRGVEVREIPPEDGHMPVRAMVEAIAYRVIWMMNNKKSSLFYKRFIMPNEAQLSIKERISSKKINNNRTLRMSKHAHSQNMNRVIKNYLAEHGKDLR